MNTKLENILFDSVKYIVLISLLIITLYPFVNIVAYAFNSPGDSVAGGLTIFPRFPTLENFVNILSKPNMERAFINSCLRVVIGVVVGVGGNALMAFVLIQKDFILNKPLNFLYVVTMYISASLIPTYFVFKALGLVNSFHAYWVPIGVIPYYMIIIRSYMYSIPESILEAAMVEGAGYLTIFRRIVIPLSLPVLATIGLFIAVDQWNAWFDVFLFNSGKQKLTTLQNEMYILHAMTLKQKLPGETVTGLPTRSFLAAMSVIVTVPVMLLYPFAQKYFVSGLVIGGVKG